MAAWVWGSVMGVRRCVDAVECLRPGGSGLVGCADVWLLGVRACGSATESSPALLLLLWLLWLVV